MSLINDESVHQLIDDDDDDINDHQHSHQQHQQHQQRQQYQQQQQQQQNQHQHRTKRQRITTTTTSNERFTEQQRQQQQQQQQQKQEQPENEQQQKQKHTLNIHEDDEEEQQQQNDQQQQHSTNNLLAIDCLRSSSSSPHSSNNSNNNINDNDDTNNNSNSNSKEIKTMAKNNNTTKMETSSPLQEQQTTTISSTTSNSHNNTTTSSVLLSSFSDTATCSNINNNNENENEKNNEENNDTKQQQLLDIKEDYILKHLKQLYFEAIFYPKFENEKLYVKTIREEMKNNIITNGYVEVSIKHSGSLLLWSGSNRYYSKNSYNNSYTICGEILLRQHFIRAYYNDYFNDDDNMNNNRNEWIYNEYMYNQCSQYIEKHSLTLSFEVITQKILGDHGQLPKRNFLILTAIANKMNGTFYNTIELCKFAQKFHLPHNDIWIYNTIQSVNELFHIYDTCREIGLSNDMIQTLSSSSNIYIPSMYHHTEFQGDIMEGIVIRYVSKPTEEHQQQQENSTSILNQLELLAVTSQELCKKIPTTLPDCYNLIRNNESLMSSSSLVSPILLINISDIINISNQNDIETTSTTTECQNPIDNSDSAKPIRINNVIEEKLRQIINSDHTINIVYNKNTSSTPSSTTSLPIQDATNIRQQYRRRRKLESITTDEVYVKQLIDKIITPSSDDSNSHDTNQQQFDQQTINIAKILHTLQTIKGSVQYNLIEEIVDEENIMIQHNNSDNMNTPTVHKENNNKDLQSNQDINNNNNKMVDDTNRNKKLIRYICIVHVLYDTTFQKFHKNMQIGDYPLFRGFSFEIKINNDENENKITSTATTTITTSIEDTNTDHKRNNILLHKMSENDVANDQDSDDHHQQQKCNQDTIMTEKQDRPVTLMLKMKLLPYMVRTFGCRNGLSIINESGPDAFMAYTNKLFTSWGISSSSQQKYAPFFRGWAEYAYECHHGCPPIEAAKSFPKLSEFHYLDHLELFQSHYEDKNKILTLTNTFQGMVIIVSVSKIISDIVAKYVAVAIGNAIIIDDITKVTSDLMCTASIKGYGRVCSTTVDNQGKLKNVYKSFDDFVSIILLGCKGNDVTAQLEKESKDTSKILGITNTWRKLRCSVIEMPLSSLSISGTLKNNFDNLNEKELKPSDEFLSKIEAIKKDRQPMNQNGRPGLLVFFPMIPGCGKSVVSSQCENVVDVRNALTKINDDGSNETLDRKLIVLVGDLIKDKYWPHVKVQKMNDTSSVYITDKNAPPRGAWETIGQICLSSKSYGVAVLPDSIALNTSIIHGARKLDGTIDLSRTHKYPFSLPFLALCMTRVLDRERGSHPGKLDKGAPSACMLVIMFYSLYRNITSEEFVHRINKSIEIGGGLLSNATIEIPVFRQECHTFPTDLEDHLKEALQCQAGLDFFKKDKTAPQKDYIDTLEQRLRSSITLHREFTLSLSVDIDESLRAFNSQLVQQICQVDSIATYEPMMHPFIKLASIDVKVADVHSLLFDMKDTVGLVPFFEIISDKRPNVEEVLNEVHCDTLQSSTKFVVKTHITMAHFKEMSQIKLRDLFSPICGVEVFVSINAILWNHRIAALSVEIPISTNSGVCIPKCNSTFPHVTVWLEKGASAVESNTLPRLVKENNAFKVELKEPILIQGVISLWE